MTDYEKHHYDKELLKQSAINLGNIDVNPIADLEQIRNLINKYLEDTPELQTLLPDWCFLDCKYKSSWFESSVAHFSIFYSVYSRTLFSCGSGPRTFALYNGHRK